MSIINHELTSDCSCEKCVSKRIHKNLLTTFPSNNGIASRYSQDFGKGKERISEFYNRSQHNAFEGVHKEHLSTGLMSSMKFDFKPFKIERENKKTEKYKIHSVPFSGLTTNKTFYPDWGSLTGTLKTEAVLPEIKIAFKGNSNYSENYIKHNEEYYKKREPAIFSKATLEFYGKFCDDTSSRSSFKPVDFNQKHYFIKEKMTKSKVEGKSTLISAEYQKSILASTYSQSYQFLSRKLDEL